MFGPNLYKPLSFGRIIGGISKTLNFANQVIPIYEQAKPLIGNARKVMSIMKEFSHTNIDLSDAKKIKNTVKSTINNSSNPVFFQ